MLVEIANKDSKSLLRKKLILLLLLRKRKLLRPVKIKKKPKFWVRKIFEECQQKGLFTVWVASSSERLCVTMRYLVTGDAQITLSTSYRISPTTIGRIIKETTEAIWSVIKEKNFLSVPVSKNEWLQVADSFETQWNFPHCLGAIDGKHVVIQAPSRSGFTRGG